MVKFRTFSDNNVPDEQEHDAKFYMHQTEPSANKTMDDSDPLIDVHDKPNRLENYKETVVGITHLVLLVGRSIVRRANELRVVQYIRHIPWRHLIRTCVTGATSKIRSGIVFVLSHKRISIISVAILCILLWTIPYIPLGNTPSKPPTATAIDEKVRQSGPIGGTTPAFDTVLPAHKSIESLGGWTRVSPPDRDPVFAYIDTLNRIQITVSQQPLPTDFSSNPDEDIKEMALDFNAKERVVADDATVYFVGTSTKGPQSVITTKNNLLILIKSPVQIKNEQWSRYIADLK